MRRGRLLAFAIAVVLVAGVPRLVRAIDGGEATEPRVFATTLPSPTSDQATPTAGIGELDRLITVVSARLDGHDNYLDVRTLGELHLARARRDGSLADYDEAVRLLTGTHQRDPDDPDGSAALAAAHLALHRFGQAADLAEAAVAVVPDHVAAHAVLGDASLATGNVATAGAAYAVLAAALPDDPAVAVRQSELSWQTGDVAGSRQHSRRAVARARALGLDGAELAFYLVYDAHRALDVGDRDAAEARLEEAGAVAPDDAAMLAELGRLRAAEGDLVAAEAAYRRSTELRPDPDTLVALGDVLTARGNTAGADDAYATVEAVAALASGAEVYRGALARFHAAHGDPGMAVELALAEAEVRGDPATLETLGRALIAAGRHAEAQQAFDRALATGVRDAGLLHASGVAAASLGDTERAVGDLEAALAIDPMFHPIEAPHAARLIAELTP
jgi:tetratricopeptide (TPR) repeat protein